MLKKIVIASILFTVISCTTKKKDNTNGNEKQIVKKNERIEQGEHKSIHQQEWEEHNKNNDITSSLINIEVKETKSITENLNKHFILPYFSSTGERLFFTTENYKGIWYYDFTKETILKINSLPGSGYKFELSADSKKVYFRNKAFIKNKPKAKYSIIEQNIENKKVNIIYMSKNVLTPPVRLGDEILFLENDKPKAYNLINKKLTDNFSSVFIYATNNKLFKYMGNKAEEIPLNGMKAISAKYTADKENIICLTAANGILLLDKNGIVINNYPKAFSLFKLAKSNLVVFTEETDNGNQIIKSELFIGFTDSDKKYKLTNLEDKKIFNPVWSNVNVENKIAYNTEDGKIKIITLNIKLKEK